MFHGLTGDLRHGVKRLTGARGFTLPAVAGLALAIGATTAVFSAYYAMLLRPMGFSGTSGLVTLWQTDSAHGQAQVEVSYADFLNWRKQAPQLQDVALASSVNLDFPLTSGGGPQLVDGTTVTGSFFHLLGAVPQLGRFFTDEDDRPGAPLRVVLSYRLWSTRFGADPSIVGRQVGMGLDTTATIIGVARPEFDFPRDVQVWLPLRVAWPTVEANAQLGVFRSIARLAPGVTAQQAQTALNVIATRMDQEKPAASRGYRVAVTPILDEIFGAARTAIFVLLGAVFLVLLIACANVANLMLARSLANGRELAIRAALGASRMRLVRQILMEALVLAAAAGALGLLIASEGAGLIARLAPEEVPRIEQTAMNLPVLLFGIALSLITVLFFGLVPALITSKRDPNESLKAADPHASGGRGQARFRQLLVAGEVALSMVLLVASGLLVRSFSKFSSLDPGFNAERILTFRITTDKGDQEPRRALYTRVLERVRSLPGVESAGAVLIRPLSGTVGWDTIYSADSESPQEQRKNPNANYEAVSPGYFRTMGIRLLNGRDFTASDTDRSEGVVIVNESTARRHWPNGNAVGRRVRLGRDAKSPWLTVVGVVHDVRYREWEAIRPDFYVPYLQRAQHRSDFVVKTAGDPWLLAEAIRKEVFALDNAQPISNVTTMEALVNRALARARFNGAALSGLAVCALLLALLGIYGVLSYSVVQRTREIGIRVAVGGAPLQIGGLLLADNFRAVAAGALFGLGAAASMARVMSTLLFQVSALDPMVYVAAPVLLLMLTLAAAFRPVLRAARVDPVTALRSE